jgi:hypothetical protein
LLGVDERRRSAAPNNPGFPTSNLASNQKERGSCPKRERGDGSSFSFAVSRFCISFDGGHVIEFPALRCRTVILHSKLVWPRYKPPLSAIRWTLLLQREIYVNGVSVASILVWLLWTSLVRGCNQTASSQEANLPISSIARHWDRRNWTV